MTEYDATLEDVVARAREKQTVESAAKARFTMGESAAGIRRNRYERLHAFYAPVDGDQWPEDKRLRPGKLHVTANIIKAFVDVEARVLSLLPRISNKPLTQDPDAAKKSEVVEELFARYLDMTGWDVWMTDRERMGALYGVKILKPFWNTKEKRPDVTLIEQPQNLLLGYGTSDYSVLDWAIYRYSISALEARIRYPGIEVTGEKGKPPMVRMAGSDHTDPLNQKSGIAATALSAVSSIVNRLNPGQTDGEYEQSQLQVWDYWYRDEDGTVCNAVLIQGCLVSGPKPHNEMPTIPYIVTEHDHEPGSPEGMSLAELLIDPQKGINRALSHYAQLVADNSGTAYQLNGENADSVPDNIVPKEDEIIPAGTGNTINPIQRGVQNYPIEALIDRYWDTAHKITGLPEVMFGELPGTQTSGRAMAVQIEAAANRLDPKRRRSYEGLRQLLLFWGYMLEEINPSVTTSARKEAGEGVGDAPSVTSQEIKIGDFIKGWQNWKIIAPEITPRDAIEHTNNVIAKVQAKLIPRILGMDELGIENPQQMQALIEAEQANVRLEPGAVQAYLAALLLTQQVAAAEAANAQGAQQMANATEATMQQDAQEAAPPKTEDMNQLGTMPGGAPPPGAPAAGGELQPIIRQTPGGESQAMSQVMLPRTGLGL